MLQPEYPLLEKQPSNYPWRAWATRQPVLHLLASQVAALNYDNFKNAIPDDKNHNACMEGRGAMWRYEEEERPWLTHNR